MRRTIILKEGGTTMSEESSIETKLLEATEQLVYAGGIHATGMDAIVKASGVARKSIYRLYPTKEALVAAALLNRDARWMAWFIRSTPPADDPFDRVMSIFPALRQWFASDGFHGCAFITPREKRKIQAARSAPFRGFISSGCSITWSNSRRRAACLIQRKPRGNCSS